MDLFPFLVLVAVVLGVLAFVFSRRRALLSDDALMRQDAAKAEVQKWRHMEGGNGGGT
jgi:hypothetical protein